MTIIKKWGPSILHGLAVVLIALTPSVQQLAVQHPTYAALIAAVWGWVLHWAQSPNSASRA